MGTHLRAPGRHLPYGITQCYLPPNTSDRASPNPSHAGWYSIYPPQRNGRLSWPSWLDSIPAGSKSDAEPLYHQDNQDDVYSEATAVNNNSRKVKVRLMVKLDDIALLKKSSQGVTCHIGSHSVTCHLTQVNTPCRNPNQTG